MIEFVELSLHSGGLSERMDSAEWNGRRPTVTQNEHWLVQDKVFQIYDIFANLPQNAKTLMLELQRDMHMEYLNRGLMQLGPSFAVLDANRPWLCYWILHSIALLGESVDYELQNSSIDFLNRCQDSNSGYGGGPGQMPHLASTYAAVNSLVTLGGSRALSSINRGKLYTFLRRMKDPEWGIQVASILDILDELVKDVGNYILSCQTYEGGIAGEPGSEAHGGYTFCGLATMILINEANRLDIDHLIDWLVFRQGVEGGFQGRTNKLVDGCYSFWQGGVFALLQRLNSRADDHVGFSDDTCEGESAEENLSESDEICHSSQRVHGEISALFHNIALQQYIILCSREQEGGFRDKPGKGRDYYHSCYCLSGLSVCQYSGSKDKYSPPLPMAVLGPYSNLLESIILYTMWSPSNTVKLGISFPPIRHLCLRFSQKFKLIVKMQTMRFSQKFKLIVKMQTMVILF